MPRSLAAALAALALALQATQAIVAFGAGRSGCCCPTVAGEHRCSCPDCARQRHQDEGCASLGGCAPDPGLVAPSSTPRPFLPAQPAAPPPLARAAPPPGAGPAPPALGPPEVPTPPPVA